VAPTPPPVQAVVPEPAPADLIVQAKEAVKQEKWSEAAALVSQATARGPVADGAALQKTIEEERENEARFETLKTAIDAKDYEAAGAAYEGIDDTSVYKERARPLGREARGKTARAEPRPTRPRPEPAGRPVVTARTPTRGTAALEPAPTRAAPVTIPPLPRPPTEPAAGGNPDAMVDEARAALFKGQYAAAAEMARKALRMRPGLPSAYQIIAVCSCYLRDSDGAEKAYNRLDDRNKQMVRPLCQKNGVTLQ